MTDDGTVQVCSAPVTVPSAKVNPQNVVVKKLVGHEDTPVFVSKGIAHVGGKLLFKKPQKQLMAGMPSIVKDNIGKLLGAKKESR
jgi:hypothetical protein